MYFGYREQNRTFEKFGVWSSGTASVSGAGDPEVRILSVTDEILPALGIPPAVGRWFSRDDDTAGTPETVILTYGYWQRHFGGDRAVLGRGLIVDSRPREMIGVMPEIFWFLDRGSGSLFRRKSRNSFRQCWERPGVRLARSQQTPSS
jgi:hypothetical protein